MGLSRVLLVITFLFAVAGLIGIFRHRTVTTATVIDGYGLGVATPMLAVVVMMGTGVFRAATALHAIYLLLTVTVPFVSLGIVVKLIRTDRVNRPPRLLMAMPAVAILAAPVGLYASHIEPRWLRVDEVTLETHVNTPIRIGVLADVQSPTVGEWQEHVIDELIAGNPDFVLVAGDIWETPTRDLDPSDREPFDALIRRLVAAVGDVYIVEGDHDRFWDLRDLAEAAGAHLVLDEVVEIEVRGQRVAIGGLAVGDKGPWRARAIAELDSRNQSDTLTILLAHRPDVINDMDDDQHVDLIVAGHTHGGQVVLPFLGPLVYYPEIPRSVTVGGLHEIDGRPIYVSTGAGVRSNTAPQVRFGSRPSIGFIDVVPAP